MAHIHARSPEQIADIQENEAECWRLYVKGKSSREIGKALGFSHEWARLTVRRLLESRDDRNDQMVRGHVEKLIDSNNLIRDAAWDGWERSKRDRVRKVEKETAGGKEGGTLESSVTTEGQSGDPAFLRVLIECDKRESALRGIEKPVQPIFQFMQTHVDIDVLITQVEEAAAKEAVEPIPDKLLEETK